MAEPKSLNEVLKGLNKKFGENVVKVGVESLEVDGTLSLGSPMADFCTHACIPEGRIIELSGPEGGGKTTSAFLICANYQKVEIKRNPDNPRTICWIDNEGTADPTWALKMGYDMSTDAAVSTIIIRPEGQNAEEIFDMSLDLLKTGEVGLLVLDSIATLVPAQIADESMEKYQMGGIAKSLTRFANTALGILRKYKCTLIGINQVRENMTAYGNPITTPGGRAWRHACSLRLMFKRGDFFDEDGNKLSTTAESPAGHIVNIAVLKIKTAPWDRKVGSYKLYYDRGVDILGDTIEAAIHLGLIDNSTQGSYKLINPNTGEILLDDNGNEIKIRGKNNIRPYFEEHLDVYHALYDKVYEKIKLKNDPFIKTFEAMLRAKEIDLFGQGLEGLVEDE